ncbi:MAG TPA: dTDP-4-dehydrorhamnose reductase [Candidatus Sulfotelmatobacter sp.]|nr:dTDP-4-dehydrorhamnose reductase [Candidatus Sulfotelmatobacter sp.]
MMVLGGSGLLGKALLADLHKEGLRGEKLFAPASGELDIRDFASVQKAVAERRPEWIILSAAYTDVDGCETHPELAFSVNRDGAVNAARAAKDAGSRLLFLSSDYVFNGKKSSPYETDDARDPQSVYGRSKAEAEVRLLDLLPGCCIVRTSWLFGVGGKCFPDTILKIAADRPVLEVVNDQRGCPTYAPDLARAIVALCRQGASGIVHATNAGECSWFEFAVEILKSAGLPNEVRPVSTQRMARPAPRPAYSVLSPRSLAERNITMPAWQDALKRYLVERGRAGA